VAFAVQWKEKAKMRKLTTCLLIIVLLSTIIGGCCAQGDNACYKAWWGLEPHPTKAGVYTGPWDRFSNPELRNLE